MYSRVVKQMLTDVSEVLTDSIIRAMTEAVRTSETLVNIYLTTWQYIPEDSKLHTRSRENMKSHELQTVRHAVQGECSVVSTCLHVLYLVKTKNCAIPQYAVLYSILVPPPC
jgi:hypothetical protein